MALRCVHLGDGLGSRAERRLGRASQITFHWNRIEVSIEAACWGHLFFRPFPFLLVCPSALPFNGLCRKSMWDRLHSGRKRVWSSTNKHPVQTAAAPKVEISADQLTLTLFWAESTLLRAVPQKATKPVVSVDFLCVSVEFYLLEDAEAPFLFFSSSTEADEGNSYSALLNS